MVELKKDVRKDSKKLEKIEVNLNKNEDTGAIKLEQMSKSLDWYERWKAAKDPNATPKILTRLSRDEHWRIRMEVANNPNTLKNTVISLREDADEDVREAAISRHRKLRM